MIPIKGGRIATGVHPATMPEIVATFGSTDRRRQVLDAAAVAVRRLRELCGDPTIYLGGPVTDAGFAGFLPYVKLGVIVETYADLTRSLVDDHVYSLLTLSQVTIVAPTALSFSTFRSVGGLVHAEANTRRTAQTIARWVGMEVDERGIEHLGGQFAGVLEVTA